MKTINPFVSCDLSVYHGVAPLKMGIFLRFQVIGPGGGISQAIEYQRVQKSKYVDSHHKIN